MFFRHHSLVKTKDGQISICSTYIYKVRIVIEGVEMFIPLFRKHLDQDILSTPRSRLKYFRKGPAVYNREKENITKTKMNNYPKLEIY